MLNNDFLPREHVNDLQLIPADGYSFLAGSGIVGDFPIAVGIDGALDFPADCDGFLAGRGTPDLVVGGFLVLIDARRADSDLISIANLGLPAQTRDVLFAVLVPAPNYLPQTAAGVFEKGFTLDRDGSVSVEQSVTGTLRIGTTPRIEVVGDPPV